MYCMLLLVTQRYRSTEMDWKSIGLNFVTAAKAMVQLARAASHRGWADAAGAAGPAAAELSLAPLRESFGGSRRGLTSTPESLAALIR
jgi:hypothetical protein